MKLLLSTSKKECAKLWENLFQLQLSPEFTKLWENFICISNIENNVLFYQCTSDLVAKSIIQTHCKMPRPIATEVDATMNLTYKENHTLRYLCLKPWRSI